MSQGSEIVVVGAGIAGVAAALRLAELGHEVLVIDRRGIGEEASGVNGGMVGGTTRSGLDGELAMGSLDLMIELQSERGHDLGLRVCGGLQVVPDASSMDAIRDRVSARQTGGDPVQLLSAHEARSLEPQLAADIAGCVYGPRQGCAEPSVATLGFAAEAARHGVRFNTGVSVAGMAAQLGGFTLRVDTHAGRLGTHGPDAADLDAGDLPAGYLDTHRSNAGGLDTQFAGPGDLISCETLVLAGGAWLAPLGQMLGAALPVVPVLGQMWATGPLPPSVHHVITSTESALHWAGSDTPSPVPDLTHDAGRRVTRHLYGRQTRTGEVVFGGDRIAQGWDKERHPEGIAVNRGQAAEVLPFLAGCATDRTWSGLMPFTSDGKPLIGRVPGPEGLYTVGGLASSGFTRGPMAGRMLAELIHDGSGSGPLKEADPARFT